MQIKIIVTRNHWALIWVFDYLMYLYTNVGNKKKIYQSYAPSTSLRRDPGVPNQRLIVVFKVENIEETGKLNNPFYINNIYHPWVIYIFFMRFNFKAGFIPYTSITLYIILCLLYCLLLTNIECYLIVKYYVYVIIN